MSVTASDWAKGIGFSIAASLIGGASKLAIRLSWLITTSQEEEEEVEEGEEQQEHIQYHQQQYYQRHHEEQQSHDNVHHDQKEFSNDHQENSSRINHLLRPHDQYDKLVDSEYILQYEQHDSIAPAPPAVTRIQEGVAGRVDRQISISSGNSCSRSSSSSADSNIPLFASSKKRRCLSRYNNSNTNSTIFHKTKRLAVALRCSGMIGMTVLNPLFCVLAMNYASPSILAPFSGLTLVWIVLFSETLIGEKPSRKQMIAASLIVLGEVVVAFWGDHTNDENITLEDVAQSYAKPLFDLYMFIMILWTTFLLYILLVQPPTIPDALNRFAWGASGGSITGLQNFLKDSLTIIKACEATGEPYPFYFYIFVLLAILSSFSGLLFLTACMKRYDATFSSAMFVGSFVISASIMSAVHYETFQNLETFWNWIMYLLGLMILMAGVKMLMSSTAHHPHVDHDHQQQQEQEETITGTPAINSNIHDTTAGMDIGEQIHHAPRGPLFHNQHESYSMNCPLIPAAVGRKSSNDDGGQSPPASSPPHVP